MEKNRLKKRINKMINLGIFEEDWLKTFIFELQLFGYPVDSWLQSFVYRTLGNGKLGCRIHNNVFKTHHRGAYATIPLSFFELNNLKWLTIDTSPKFRRGVHPVRLDNLPAQIGNLEGLESLMINVHDLAELPKSIGLLINLRELYITGGIFTHIPEEFQNLKLLQKLQISNSEIKIIPGWIFKLPNLEEFDAKNNKIEQILMPKNISDTLYRVDLRDNKLSRIPEIIDKNVPQVLS